VVIPTLGRPILECALASLVAGTAWPARIVVVDQSADDQVARMLEKTERAGVRTRRVVSPPRGRAPALNLGVRAVDSRFLAITDDDCVVAPDWLECLLGRLHSHGNTIVSGRVEDVGDEESVANVLGRTPVTRTRPSLRFDVMTGANMGIEKTVYDHVGAFDEDPRLRLAEDTEYAYRALRRGVTLMYAPEVRIWHYAWRDLGERERQFRGYARSHGGYYGKYIRKGDLFIVAKAIVHMTRSLRRWTLASWRGNENMAAHGKAYSLSLVPGIIAGLRKPGPGVDTQ
jgi:GT2 family glycosyltransferase